MIIFKYGCMGSGKSLQLMAAAYNFQEHNIPFLIFKPSIDTRDGENVIFSRALGKMPCTMIDPEFNLFDAVFNIVENKKIVIKWIMVDECQFLTERQVDELTLIADVFNISVVCYGLRTDFQTKLFPGSKRLFELADKIEEIFSTCSVCGGKATINARISSDGSVITEGEQVEIGGDEQYVSLCRDCFQDFQI